MNLDYLNIINNRYKRNSSADQLIQDSIASKEGVIGLNGALMVDTGEFSGRIPNDKFIVDQESSSENIWWGNINQKISEQNSWKTVAYAAEAGQFHEAGYQSIICGPGSIEQAHRANEYTTQEQLDKCVVMLQKLVVEFSI